MYIIEQEIRDLIDKSCLDGHGIDEIGGYGGQFLMCSSKMWSDIGNWPKKSNALALALVSQKGNALVIKHYFYRKSNALVTSH